MERKGEPTGPRLFRRRVGGFLPLLTGATFLSSCLPTSESAAEVLFEEGAQAPIARFLAAPSPGVTIEEELIRQIEEALQRWRSGDRAAATLDVDRALASLPALADWRPLIVAELLAATQDTAAVRARLELLEPDSGMKVRWGWQILAETLERARDFPRAEAVAIASVVDEVEPGRRAAKWLFAARMALAAGDTARAQGHLLDALAEGESYAGARDAARLLDRFDLPLEPEDSRQVVRGLAGAGVWDRVYARALPWLSDTSASGNEREELRAIAGRALVELGRYSDAETLLEPLRRESDTSRPVLEAFLWSGRAALARGSVGTAERHFRALARAAPDSPLAEEAFALLLGRELETGFGPRSRGYLDELLQVDIRAPEVEALVVRLGTTLYHRGEFTAAARIFDLFEERSLRLAARQQAAYWAGLARDRVGESTAARDRWREAYEFEPLTFYGILAAERIDAPLLASDLRAGPAQTPGRAGELHNAIVRLRVHRLVPTAGSFNFELERLTSYFSAFENGWYDFAEELIAGGFPLQGAVIGRDLVQAEGGWNLRLLRIVHPFPHRDLVVREAQARGLSPFFVAGVIRQESLFQSTAQSSSGAMGLMQLMPATAREVAGSLGVPFAQDRLVDPETNIRFGTTYLATMLRRFGGRPEDALAAYNAGPTRARQWQQLPEYTDPAVFTEHIPFQETRNYVKLVQQYARIYAALYGCGEFEPCLGLPPSRIATFAQVLPGNEALPGNQALSGNQAAVETRAALESRAATF